MRFSMMRRWKNGGARAVEMRRTLPPDLLGQVGALDNPEAIAL